MNPRRYYGNINEGEGGGDQDVMKITDAMSEVQSSNGAVSGVDSEKENCVYELNLMSICTRINNNNLKCESPAADFFCSDRSNNFNNDNYNDEINDTTTPAISSASSESLAREVTIDRNEEKQTLTELVRATGTANLIKNDRNNSVRIALGLLLRLVLPLANGFVRGIKGIRDVRFLNVIKAIVSSRHSLTNLIAFAANTMSMNLSAVQVSHRIEPILRLIKLRRSSDEVESLPDSPTFLLSSPSKSSKSTMPTMSYFPIFREPNGAAFPYFRIPSGLGSSPPTPPAGQSAPKCCTLNILAEPPAGMPVRADIVFIHGLRGSLVNTWKQGLWQNERQPVEFERPPKPAVRPPKRPRHTRTSTLRPPHKQKRARFANSEFFKYSSDPDTHDELEHSWDNSSDRDFSFLCDQPQDIRVCHGVEYSFPMLRLRMHDHGCLIQTEIESILDDQSTGLGPISSQTESDSNDDSYTETKPYTKPSIDDPNYSKCWPGDWLPMDCPGVRVIAINYTTDKYLWRPLWKGKEPRTNLQQRAREMAELLIEQRVGCGHPIIWVGHSKGGLFVKQIIVDAWESGLSRMTPFWRAARGCFFYSVPHRGSHLASLRAPLMSRSVELIDIEKNSKYLLDLHRRFAALYHLGHLKIEVFSFVETALTLMSVLYLRIVGADSADPGIGDVCGIRLDHREICKPRSRNCILYKKLVQMINKVC